MLTYIANPTGTARLGASPFDETDVFPDSASRNAYLLSAIRYAGQLVADNETEAVYLINTALNAYIKILDFGDISTDPNFTLDTTKLADRQTIAAHIAAIIGALTSDDIDDSASLLKKFVTPAQLAKLDAIDAAHYGDPLQTLAELTAQPEAGLVDKQRHYVEDETSDYFYNAQATSGDAAPDDQTGGTGWWKKVSLDGETPASIKTKYESNPNTEGFTTAFLNKLSLIEDGAQVNQTDAEIKVQYENNVDTNAFTDAEKAKVAFITVSKNINLDDLEGIIGERSSGVITGGELSINADNTKFDISDMVGHVISTLVNPATYTKVSTTGLTAITVTNLGTQKYTYVLINNAGAIVQQASRPTEAELRNNIFLGRLVHTNLTNITAVESNKVWSLNTLSQLTDFMEAVGNLNLSGNVITPNGTNLFLDKSQGEIFKWGCNPNSQSPHKKTLGNLTQLTFTYRLQDGTELPATNTLDFSTYDDGSSTPATVTNNDYTIQRVYVTQSNEIIIQKGQTIYETLNIAIAAVFEESFVIEEDLRKNAIPLAYIAAREDVTNLQQANRAAFFKAGKFDNAVALGGISTITNLQTAYGNSLADAEITTDDLGGAFTLKRGTSGGDSDVVLEIKNGSDLVVLTITADGLINGIDITNLTPIQSVRIDVESGITTFEVPFDGAINGEVLRFAEAEIAQINVTARVEGSTPDLSGLHLSTTDGVVFTDESGGSGASSITNYFLSKADSDRTYLIFTVDTGSWTSLTSFIFQYTQA